MKKGNIITIILILISATAYSQIWTIRFGSDWSDYSYVSTTDLAGSTFMAGQFDGNNLFSPIDTLHETVNGDMFLTRIDPNGNCSWIKQIQSSFSDSTSHSTLYEIVLDEVNQVGYLLIQSDGQVWVDSIHIFSHGGLDILLLKFDYSGNIKWIKSAGGPFDDKGSGIALDSVGNIYVCGTNGPNATFDTISISQEGSYLAKYDTAGTCQWVKKISNNRFQSNLLEYRNMGLILEGKTYDSSRVDTINLPHISNHCAHVFAGFNLSGSILWAKEVIYPDNSNVFDMALDGDGNIYSAGYFYDSLDFGGTILVNDSGKSDVLFFRMDSVGNLVWSKKLNANASGAFSISSNNSGNIYLTGIFRDSMTFEGNSIISNFPHEMFLAHYDSAGNFHGVIHFGQAVGTSVGQDANENPYVTCHILGAINLGAASYTSYGSSDILVAKFDAIDNIEDHQKLGNQGLVIYANPNSGKCHIQIPGEFQNKRELNMKIYAASGSMLQNKTVQLNSESVFVDLENEAAGIYLVTLSDGQKIYWGKIIFGE